MVIIKADRSTALHVGQAIGWMYYYAHFTDEALEAWGSEVTCQRAHSV